MFVFLFFFIFALIFIFPFRGLQILCVFWFREEMTSAFWMLPTMSLDVSFFILHRHFTTHSHVLFVRFALFLLRSSELVSLLLRTLSTESSIFALENTSERSCVIRWWFVCLLGEHSICHRSIYLPFQVMFGMDANVSSFKTKPWSFAPEECQKWSSVMRWGIPPQCGSNVPEIGNCESDSCCWGQLF